MCAEVPLWEIAVGGLDVASKTRLHLVAVAAAMILATGSVDGSPRASIVQIDADSFEVVPGSGGSSGWAYWCAAGYYVARTQRQSWQTEITISRGRARSQSAGGRETVAFTTNAAGLGIDKLPTRSINALKVGETMSAQQAHSYCQQGGAGSSR